MAQFEEMPINIIEKTIKGLTVTCMYIGMLIMTALVLLTVVHGLGRYFFNKPVFGVIDITNHIVITGVFMVMAYTMIKGDHIRIGVVVDALPLKAQNIMIMITDTITMIFLILAVWTTFDIVSAVSRQVSAVVHIPRAPFMVIVGIGWLLLTTAAGLNLVKTTGKFKKPKLGLALIIIAIVISLLVIFFEPLSAVLRRTDPVTVGVIGAIIMAVMLFSGAPIAVVMGFTGLIGVGLFRGWGIAFTSLGTIPFSTLNNYTWSTIPVFVLMGFLAKNTQLAGDFYFGVRQWIGHLKGGLLNAVILGNGAFGACSGDNIAAAVTFCSISLPETRKYNYDDGFTMASVAAGAILATLIPPSMGFIIYGSLTQTSIGRLFIAGILPGLLLMTMYMVMVNIMVRRHPELAPLAPKVPRKEALKSSGGMFFLIIVFVVIIGGIYLGLFTPTEAGAFGTFTVAVLALIRRKLKLSNFLLTLEESAGCLGMIGLLLAGSMVFNLFVVVTGIPDAISSMVTGFSSSPIVFLLITMIVLAVLGTFIDALPLILLIVPILFPIAKSLGIDPVHYGVVTCVVIMLGTLTPPVGILIYAVSGVDREVPMFSIFRGAVPYMILLFLFTMILIAWPSLSLTLVKLMF